MLSPPRFYSPSFSVIFLSCQLQMKATPSAKTISIQQINAFRLNPRQQR